MNRFTQLFDSVSGRIARRDVYTIFSDSGWHYLTETDRPAINSSSYVLVIAVALYSKVDVAWLDRAMDLLRDTQPEIYVFELDNVQNMASLHEYLPDAPIPVSTPFIAEYRDGHFVSHVQGRASHDWLRRLSSSTASDLG